jgi:cytochrome c biogenesis protein
MARKKILGIFGSDVVHLGLLIILAGGIVSGLTSVRKELALKEGETFPVPKSSFELRLDKFTTEYYSDGSVKAWKSAVTVIENANPVLAKTIVVNRPLTYHGYSFYQTSYGWNWDNPAVEIWSKKKNDPSFLKKLKLKVGEQVPLDDKDQTSVSVARFIPDFVLGEGNEPQTRSLQPNNPAAFVEGFRGGEKIFSGWIFANFPDMDRIHAAKETDLSFELKSFEAGQYSVLEAAKDPGANLIWIGCILTMLGLALAFYWPHWEIKAVLEESQGKTEVIAGGIALKNRDSFQSEFEKIMTSARRTQ